MLCIADDPVVPFVVAFQSVGAILLVIVLSVFIARDKKRFTPRVRAICLLVMLGVVLVAVAYAATLAGNPCPQPDLSP